MGSEGQRPGPRPLRDSLRLRLAGNTVRLPVTAVDIPGDGAAELAGPGDPAGAVLGTSLAAALARGLAVRSTCGPGNWLPLRRRLRRTRAPRAGLLQRRTGSGQRAAGTRRPGRSWMVQESAADDDPADDRSPAGRATPRTRAECAPWCSRTGDGRSSGRGDPRARACLPAARPPVAGPRRRASRPQSGRAPDGARRPAARPPAARSARPPG